MALSRRDLAVLAAAAALSPAGARAQTRQISLIALGGASSERPPGSGLAFELAIAEGADFIETGLAPTQDGALIAREDHELSATTDVASRPDFAARRTSKTIDGAPVEGWFSEDFALAELKTLTCRMPGARARPGPYDGKAAILTFQEVIDLARAASVREARVIGVCATLKRSTYFAAMDLALESRAAEVIHTNGYNWPAAAMIVRNRDLDALKTLGGLTRARRAWLMSPGAGPSTDFASAREHAEILAPLATDIFDLTQPTAVTSPLIAAARAAGLVVQAQILPDGELYPPRPFRRGDLRGFYAALSAAGVDAIATATPGIAGRGRSD
jgi:glycerophosphoryl diester phosphodiesterase